MTRTMKSTIAPCFSLRFGELMPCAMLPRFLFVIALGGVVWGEDHVRLLMKLDWVQETPKIVE